jgi:peptidoglycan hydrolase-like protein with peptidoglycan-binding domain
MADGALHWPRLRRRGWLVAGTAALAAAAVAAAVSARLAAPGAHGPAGTRLTTAPVVRTSLTTSIGVAGALGYAGSFAAVDELAGTAYTALPAPGTVVRRGQRLYEVDGRPVVLFYGARPEWRDLAAGVATGPDIAQLNANLAALGYAAAGGDAFTAATAYAVARWQAALGLPVTGTVPAGQIAYAPGPLRVAAVLAGLGTPAQPGGTVLTATSPDPVVRASVPVAQEYLVRAGDHVTVTLPDGTAVPGTVLVVARVATAARDAAGDGSGPGGQLTVQATVRLGRPAGAAGLDQAPVTVSIVSARAQHVLAVPVSALVALAGGGYAVQVPRARGGQRLVAVRLGLFGGSLVQVSGALRPGLRVTVPAP